MTHPGSSPEYRLTLTHACSERAPRRERSRFAGMRTRHPTIHPSSRSTTATAPASTAGGTTSRIRMSRDSPTTRNARHTTRNTRTEPPRSRATSRYESCGTSSNASRTDSIRRVVRDRTTGNPVILNRAARPRSVAGLFDRSVLLADHEPLPSPRVSYVPRIA